MEKKTVVLASNYEQFVRWCRLNDINPCSRSVIYASGTGALLGRCLCDDCVEIIRYQNYNSHPNFGAIYDMMQMYIAMGHRGA